MEENLSVETQEVAAPVEENVVETSEQTQEVAEPETQIEVEQPKVERDYERDAAFAQMRRNMEQAQKEREEFQKQFEAMKAERERLTNSFGLFGFKGNVDEIEDQAKAHYMGKTVEEVRNERLQAQKALEEQQKREQETLAKDNQIKDLQQQLYARILADDLKKIQALDANVKSLDELGDKYMKMMMSGDFTAEEAYLAVKSIENANKKTPPPEIGKVNATQKADKTYYTQEEVDAMIAADDKALDNPSVLEKIRKSMTKW
jgi:hypothetical protein